VAAAVVSQTDASDETKALVIGGAVVGGALLGMGIAALIDSATSAEETPQAPSDDEKKHIEILEHKVRAVYEVKMCAQHKCRIVKDKNLKIDGEIRLAVHLMQGTSRDDNDVREQIYKWMRRCMAQAHLRPHLKVLHTVAVSKNMLTIADGDGRFTSGVTVPNAASGMTIRIGGRDYVHTISANAAAPTHDSPAATAQKLKRLLENNGFRVDGPYPVKVSGLTPVAGSVGPPQDILVFDSSHRPVVVEGVTFTDTQQNLIHTNDTNVDNFKVNWPYQPRDARSMHYNYRTQFFDIFVCGTILRKMWDGGTLFGFSPYGNFDTYDTDIGPITFLNADAMSAALKPFNPSHEMMHPLMHVTHTVAPAGQYEIMNASTSTADGKDATKHIADAPIAITYQVVGKGDVLLNGQPQALTGGGSLTDTPVLRVQLVGRSYNKIAPLSARRLDVG
jgi:hypothetical protein